MEDIPALWRGCNQNQRDVLVVVARQAGATGTEIAAELGIDHASVVNRVCESLHEKGLLERVEDESQPGHPVSNHLTDRGREMLRDVGTVWHEVSVGVAP